MQDFQRLTVWRLAHDFRLRVYRVVEDYPHHEQRGLTEQTRRSASSIGWNIAEGCGRGSDPDFARFLQMATGSAYECLDQLIQARDLEYLPGAAFDDLAASLHSLCRQIIALMKYLRRTPRR